MTRLEPLIVTALGRSPYDDELIRNEDPDHVPGTIRTGQQYDDRGRPMNRETLQQSRSLVRASNEVLAAAGIIETAEGFKARDAAKIKERDAREEDIQKAYRRRAYGQIALTCGVWGACGLRRRIELYKDYSKHPLLALIRNEQQTSSLLRIFGAGLPALMLNRAIGNVAHFFTTNPFSRTTKTIITYATNYIMFHYKYFAILQQLGLLPSSFPYGVVPPLSFMVPFSSTSPFYLPAIPAAWTLFTTLDFASKAALVVAPVIFLQVWYRLSNWVISEIYDPVYSLLPHATNLPAAESIAAAEAKDARRARVASQLRDSEARNRASAPSPEADLVVINEDDASDSASDTDGNSTTTWNEDEYADLPPRPQNPTPTSDPTTLRALEGRDDVPPSTNPVSSSQPDRLRARRDSLASSHSSDAGETTTTLITFDVEHTDEPMPEAGSYSAELRQAPPDHPPSSKKSIPEYNVTATSIMPAHLFADGVTVLLSTASTVLLETMMVRAVAASWYGRGKGGGSWGGDGRIWPVFTRKGGRLPWKGVGNIGLVFLADLAMTGVIWAGCMGVMWVADKVFREEKEEKEGKAPSPWEFNILEVPED